ncbi:unnamed protein product [Albugo candida]|uniref:Uncharacterized protein n=1 Tax=Albugo candida TaxID=65357 RepID=A0A024GH69_9STRA|nr:unnamed protein product [Albugo candida]|eukprot:CCI46233.1 unnamed protein product [Albugo candida]
MKGCLLFHSTIVIHGDNIVICMFDPGPFLELQALQMAHRSTILFIHMETKPLPEAFFLLEHCKNANDTTNHLKKYPVYQYRVPHKHRILRQDVCFQPPIHTRGASCRKLGQ